MKRQQILDALDIRPGDYVVEVGAGSVPFPASRLIIDKHPFDEAERCGPIPNLVPILKADALELPLRRASCDVIFMSHVIEHLNDPLRFLEHAQRCTDRIYLEFPSLERELLYSWSYHPWLVVPHEGALRFHRNDLPQQFGGLFHEHYDFLLDLWSTRRHELLNGWWFGPARALRFEFPALTAADLVRSTCPVGAERSNYRGPYAEIGVGPLEYSLGDRAKLALWSILPSGLLKRRRQRQFLRDRDPGPPVALSASDLARLRCTHCRDEGSRLERRGEALACTGCGQQFQRERGVYDFDVMAPALSHA